MATDPIHSYLEARSQLERATTSAERVVYVVRSAAEALRSWRQAMVLNGQGEFPMEAGFKPRASLDAGDWPTGQQIADVLIAWHNANLAVMNAWDRVPPELRSGLNPPPRF